MITTKTTITTDVLTDELFLGEGNDSITAYLGFGLFFIVNLFSMIL